MHDFQQDVNRLLKWCQINRLSINVKKTKLVFHPHSANVKNNIKGKLAHKINNNFTELISFGSYIWRILGIK